VIYPYEQNNYQTRSHDQFVATAKEVESRLCIIGERSTSINGIKGLSPMLKLFCYPMDILYDYMHLVCLNHVPTLIKRFLHVLSSASIAEIDSVLTKIRLPHDVSIKYDYSLRLIQDWKAKHTRLFVLNIGLPILAQHLPMLLLSHFSIYCMFIKIVHCPTSDEEIQLADRLIHYYCQSSSQVYDPKIELYSLHAHLHLPAQVSSE
jgi:hypothetical protein